MEIVPWAQENQSALRIESFPGLCYNGYGLGTGNAPACLPWEVVVLADSGITKKALASALKELMQTTPFAKISVSDICEKCDMNRKSFYYHFKDKYDLVNWIFFTEALLPLHEQSCDRLRDVLPVICQHLYDHRAFYRKAFRITGQNAFPEYFREMLEPLLIKASEKLMEDEKDRAFYLTFFAGSFITAIERWIKEPDCIPADEFIRKTRSCFICIASKMMTYYQ